MNYKEMIKDNDMLRITTLRIITDKCLKIRKRCDKCKGRRNIAKMYPLWITGKGKMVFLCDKCLNNPVCHSK